MSRASGERSQEETKRLQQEILEVQEELDKKKEALQKLTISNKQLEDERRNIERTINKIKDQSSSSRMRWLMGTLRRCSRTRRRLSCSTIA